MPRPPAPGEIHATRIELTGLTEAAVADLVADLAGGKPDGNLLRLADGAAGNPLYVTELITALTRSSKVIITGTGVATLAAGSAPDSLSAAIADRLGFATTPVREVLRAAALLGTDFAVTDLGIILGRGVADLVGVIDEARAAGVLAESGHGLGFRHPLIRAALEAAAGQFVHADDRSQARAAFSAAVEVYTSLDAAADVARLRVMSRDCGR